MSDRGHAAVELGLAVGLLLLPVALATLAFGPWSERRVFAEAAAAEAARAAVIELSTAPGSVVVSDMDVASQDVDLVDLVVSTASDGSSVSVLVGGELELGLIGVFVDQREPLTVIARASAVPVLVP